MILLLYFSPVMALDPAPNRRLNEAESLILPFDTPMSVLESVTH